MTKFRTFSFMFLLMLAFSACNPQGESYQKFTGYVNVMETVIPDSAIVGQTIPVYARAVAPNGCWSDLKINLMRSVYFDSLYAISATGKFESYNGLCAEIIITADTIFEFKPDSAGTYIFASYSSAMVPFYDTIYIMDSVQGSRRFFK